MLLTTSTATTVAKPEKKKADDCISFVSPASILRVGLSISDQYAAARDDRGQNDPFT